MWFIDPIPIPPPSATCLTGITTFWGGFWSLVHLFDLFFMAAFPSACGYPCLLQHVATSSPQSRFLQWIWQEIAQMTWQRTWHGPTGHGKRGTWWSGWSEMDKIFTGWWFGAFFILFPYIGNNHPNCLIFFQRGSNHQPVQFYELLVFNHGKLNIPERKNGCF